MHMINNKIECIYLEKFTKWDRTLILNNVWKQKKQPSEQKDKKNSKYIGLAEAQETTVKVHI